MESIATTERMQRDLDNEPGASAAGPLDNEGLWRELRDALFGFIRARVADDATADDLVQDTFLKVHANLDQLTDDTRLSAWVYRIARNRLTDHYRQRTAPTTSADELAADDDGDEHNRDNELVGTWLAALIDSLPPRYRDAVRLVEVDGLSQTEAADRLGLSVSGAKSRVQRGRAQLRTALDDCCKVEMDRRGNVLEIQPRSTCC